MQRLSAYFIKIIHVYKQVKSGKSMYLHDDSMTVGHDSRNSYYHRYKILINNTLTHLYDSMIVIHIKSYDKRERKKKDLIYIKFILEISAYFCHKHPHRSQV